MRSRDWGWWRPLLGLLLFAVVYVVAGVLARGRSSRCCPPASSPDLGAARRTSPTRASLLVTNLSLIVAIPVVWLAWVAAHGMGIGWSSSVLGRLRWRLFLP